MRISIVIPIYNVAAYLPACMESVLGQDLRDAEVLLVDDGSSDGKSGPMCDEYAGKYPEKIRVIHQKNLGLGGARNTGLEAAKGTYLLFLDSDDTLAPEALTVLYRAADREPDAAVFPLGVRDEAGRPLPTLGHSAPAGQLVSLAQVPALLLDPPSACMRLWKRSLFLDTGIRFPEHQLYEDLCTTPKLLLAAKSILGLDQALYLYCQRGGSIMRGGDPGKNRQILTALDSVLDWYRNRGAAETYGRELDALVLHHVYDAAYRVLRLDRKDPLLQTLLAYLRKKAPDYRRCPYYSTLTRSQRLTLAAMERGHTALPAAVFAGKDRLRAMRARRRNP